MTGVKGRKAQLFQRAVKDARRRQEHELNARAAEQSGGRIEETKANEVEKMLSRIKSAFRAADAA